MVTETDQITENHQGDQAITPTTIPTVTNHPTETGNDMPTTLTLETFNCHGFKQSTDFIIKRLSNTDIMCLCETWLKRQENDLISSVINGAGFSDEFVVFQKSGMVDNDVNIKGRPYGGLAVICKKRKDLCFSWLPCDNDRLCTILVSDHKNNPIQVIVNVYLPYFDRSKLDNTEMYIKTINDLQLILDSYSSIAPVKVVGDFNVQLPSEKTARNRLWEKLDGFNKHSRILHDFIISNSLICADQLFKQPVKYTFFNIKRDIFTWLDHVICSRQKADILSCQIIPLNEDNLSDHLPVRLVFKFLIPKHSEVTSTLSNYMQNCVSWKNEENNARFKTCLIEQLNNLPTIDCFNDDHDDESKQCYIDDYINKLCSTIFDAAKRSNCHPDHHFRPKKYWCPHLTSMRNTKRFWWHLWVENGRPRSGEVFNCYKGVKRLYRKLCRYYANYYTDESYRFLDDLFVRDRNKFWKHIRRKRKKQSNGAVSVDKFVNYFSNIMQDDGGNTCNAVSTAVTEEYNRVCKLNCDIDISPSTISEYIGKLKKNSSPGIDGITAEYFIHGHSDVLCNHLSKFYNYILKFNCIPRVFSTGVLVPILKKPSLDPTIVSNYMPITLSSILSKLFEAIVSPTDVSLSCNQFGFRPGYCTSYGSALINDLMHYADYTESNMYLCSLDAEKCFDSIWHDGLFYKLLIEKVLNKFIWRTLYNWYRHLNVVVKWNDQIHFDNSFNVTRGTRQGSLLSPLFFNIYLKDLMCRLQSCNEGVLIGDRFFNSFAYADDISIFSSTVCGLQNLINVCSEYARDWRLVFGCAKSKCLISGKIKFIQEPRWFLDNKVIENVDKFDILGTTFSSSNSFLDHLENRVGKSKKSFYSLKQQGLCYPGLNTVSKTALYNSVCQPVLTYGFDALYINEPGIERLEKAQGFIVKQFLGLDNRHHHTNLVDALGIRKISQVIEWGVVSLYRRLFIVDSPLRDFNYHLLSLLLCKGIIVPGTLIDRVCCFGYSPINTALNRVLYKRKHVFISDGLTDSLKSLLFSEHFNLPWSGEHHLVQLLTKAF